MVDLGIYNVRKGNPITEPKITYQMNNSITTVREANPNVHIIFQSTYYNNGAAPTPWPVTDLVWIKSRFDLYEQYKTENWEYGTYLGCEELFHPSIMAQWYHNPSGQRYDGLLTWTIDGADFTKYGITVKAFKPWITTNKPGGWSDTWWNTVKANNQFDDEYVWKWSLYYARQLYEMWHLHMHALGKKSYIGGYIGIPSDINGASWKYVGNTWGTELHNYIMNNYDMISAYQYPECISGCVAGTPNPIPQDPNHLYHTARNISWSIDAANTIKNTYNFKGKILWILTSHWPDSVGTYNKNVVLEEYKAVLPYVDIMCLPEFSDMWVQSGQPWIPGQPYSFSVPILLDCCTTTGTCPGDCPPLKCNLIF